MDNAYTVYYADYIWLERCVGACVLKKKVTLICSYTRQWHGRSWNPPHWNCDPFTAREITSILRDTCSLNHLKE